MMTVAGRWVKSRASFAHGNCVEMALLDDGQVGVRDSKDPDAVLEFTREQWAAFLAWVRAGET